MVLPLPPPAWSRTMEEDRQIPSASKLVPWKLGDFGVTHLGQYSWKGHGSFLPLCPSCLSVYVQTSAYQTAFICLA